MSADAVSGQRPFSLPSRVPITRTAVFVCGTPAFHLPEDESSGFLAILPVGSLGSLQWALCAALLTEWQGHWYLTQMCPQNSCVGPLHKLVRRSGRLMCWWRLLLWTAFHISLDIWTYSSRHPVWGIVFCGAGLQSPCRESSYLICAKTEGRTQ